jgi:hypothetical protein
MGPSKHTYAQMCLTQGEFALISESLKEKHTREKE